NSAIAKGCAARSVRRARGSPASSSSRMYGLLRGGVPDYRRGAERPAGLPPAACPCLHSPQFAVADGTRVPLAVALSPVYDGTASTRTSEIAPTTASLTPSSQAVDDQIDGGRKPFPALFFLFQPRASGRSERIELRLPARLALIPPGPYPALLF